MPRLSIDKNPKLRRHAASGQAVVTLSGKDHDLGKWGVTTSASTTLNQSGTASYTNFTHGGGLTVAAGIAATTMNGFTIQGSGSIAVGAGSTVNAANFQTCGVMMLAPGASFAGRTQLTNAGTSHLFFNGGSRTFIGTPATAANKTHTAPSASETPGDTLTSFSARWASGSTVDRVE